jgi:hypothetical protein
VSRAFNARVQSRFPVGSSEADILAELRREQFKISAYDEAVSRYQFSAVRDLPGVACKLFWTIQWNADAGKIAEIAGTYSGSCL